jgi:hypothetical protein
MILKCLLIEGDYLPNNVQKFHLIFNITQNISFSPFNYKNINKKSK